MFVFRSEADRNLNMDVEKSALTLNEFCASHSITRATFYRLEKAGAGPIVMNVGGLRLVSVEAAEAWRRQREQAPRKPNGRGGNFRRKATATATAT
jgi:predicted DNA-binding transcriptional regulator AlpA